MTVFTDNVQEILEPTLRNKGFVLDQIYDGIDEGGRHLCVVYYRGADTKLQVYNSSREGEINCMIAPLSARNEFGLRSSPPLWQFVSRFEHRINLSFADALKMASTERASQESVLRRVQSRIESNFDAARSLLLATGRTGTLIEDLTPIRNDQTGLAGRIAVLIADLPGAGALPANVSDTDAVVILDDTFKTNSTVRVHPIGDPRTIVDVDVDLLALAPTLGSSNAS